MNKYHAKRTNGYASKREANVAANLHALARGGIITDLKEQVAYVLVPAQRGKLRNEKPLTYIADFVFNDEGNIRVLDAKGVKTPLYVAKRKLMKFVHNIEVEEY